MTVIELSLATCATGSSPAITFRQPGNEELLPRPVNIATDYVKLSSKHAKDPEKQHQGGRQAVTPRERVLAALHGQMPDRVPFTCYDCLLPSGEVEQQVRNEGLALITDCGVFTTKRPHVEVSHRDYYDDGTLYIRDTYATPAGEVWQTRRTGGAYNTTRLAEYLIKQPEDYETVEFMVRDEVYAPNYEKYLIAVNIMGEAGLVLGGWLPRTPMMAMMWELMSHEQFAVDMHERPDEFFGLYETIARRRREQYEIAAASPAPVLHVGDNITADMIGLERFEQYCVPCYDEFAAHLHAEGKLLAVHMDGRMKVLTDAVANSEVDIIEAFAAVPDGDLELAEARRAWPDKIIWTNYPSPVHLWPPDEIAAYTRQMLRDIAPGDRFLVGITENSPDRVFQTSMATISRVLTGEASLPLPCPQE